MSLSEDGSSPTLSPSCPGYKIGRLANREHSQYSWRLEDKLSLNRQLVKMKAAILVILIIGLTALAESFPGLGNSRQPAPYINRIPPPKPRFRRSADPEPQGSLSATWQKNLNGPERRPSYNVDYQHKLFENQHGSISATGGAQKLPSQRWEPNVGIQGSFRFRRSPEPQPEPQGSFSASWQKNLGGPERRPSYNLDYQHRIFENQQGSISATAGAQKFPGQGWQPHVGIQGTRLFENRRGSVSATAGAQKFPGQRWQPHVGIQGTWRFRRSAESGEEIDQQE